METNENNEPKEEQTISISDKVDQSVVSQLTELGYSKVVAEKACFLSRNNLNEAIDWVNEHANDPDFEEELVIVGQEEK